MQDQPILFESWFLMTTENKTSTVDSGTDVTNRTRTHGTYMQTGPSTGRFVTRSLPLDFSLLQDEMWMSPPLQIGGPRIFPPLES